MIYDAAVIIKDCQIEGRKLGSKSQHQEPEHRFQSSVLDLRTSVSGSRSMSNGELLFYMSLRLCILLLLDNQSWEVWS
ncbi:hypothetical protein GE21DRAFT_3466 [Neurospora crassa]|uniref:Uncharacterized protein n=2 Tax=Neurospora crassa TaxID=5141 RepID=Q1K5J9_NEUCR|nr:hypothetical protein NCU01520 [Neurospora crassa OR74A]EAA27733.1 hypothetical protein NCU01520 [Neurospora crassa OR74A]KHE87223.1 hypothetical protein GE21DRAFT_3466 [Neurospora crassa]CAB91421.1 conserved hypothetical protein [Neurospora crassa]|eukprot:XP_956969.1 hypothetical protein NCU01520 [Neurospora crassa OR74A]